MMFLFFIFFYISSFYSMQKYCFFYDEVKKREERAIEIIYYIKTCIEKYKVNPQILYSTDNIENTKQKININNSSLRQFIGEMANQNNIQLNNSCCNQGVTFSLNHKVGNFQIINFQAIFHSGNFCNYFKKIQNEDFFKKEPEYIILLVGAGCGNVSNIPVLDFQKRNKNVFVLLNDINKFSSESFNENTGIVVKDFLIGDGILNLENVLKDNKKKINFVDCSNVLHYYRGFNQYKTFLDSVASNLRPFGRLVITSYPLIKIGFTETEKGTFASGANPVVSNVSNFFEEKARINNILDLIKKYSVRLNIDLKGDWDKVVDGFLQSKSEESKSAIEIINKDINDDSNKVRINTINLFKAIQETRSKWKQFTVSLISNSPFPISSYIENLENIEYYKNFDPRFMIIKKIGSFDGVKMFVNDPINIGKYNTENCILFGKKFCELTKNCGFIDFGIQILIDKA
jgi:hypothetical protein